MRNNQIQPIRINYVGFGFDGFEFTIEVDNDMVYYIEVDMEYSNPSGLQYENVSINYSLTNEKVEDAETLLARYIKKYIERIKYMDIPKSYPKSISKKVNAKYFTFVSLMLSAKESSKGCLAYEGETNLYKLFKNV